MIRASLASGTFLSVDGAQAAHPNYPDCADPTTRAFLGQGCAIYENVHTPCEYFNCIKQYNTRDISPLLTQDVLVLAGAEDLYTVYYDEQLRALTNARSVTGRLFTAEECASHHCQIGNLQLVLETIDHWIGMRSNGEKSDP